MEYTAIVLHNLNIDLLIEEIKRMIKEGWKIMGGIVVYKDEYFQAMINDESNKCIWEMIPPVHPWYKSECGFKIRYTDEFETLVHEMDFCPNCGKSIDKRACGKAGQKWFGWTAKHKEE